MPRTIEPELRSDSFSRPALSSLLLHLLVVGSVVLYVIVLAKLHGNTWGNNAATQGAIQATMVSSAPAIPLPRDEQKQTDSVLATETPSAAPAPPAPKAAAAEPDNSIPIPVRQPVKPRPEPRKTAPAPPTPKPLPTRPSTQPSHVRLIRPEDRATFGEAAPSTPRSMAQATPSAQVNVQGGDFGSRFPWYVDVIKRKTAQNWYKQEVDPGTPSGSRVFLTFSVARDGSPSGVRIAQSSGSSSLDSSCMRAVQRVDTYGSLPGGYAGSSLQVSYYCEQAGR